MIPVRGVVLFIPLLLLQGQPAQDPPLSRREFESRMMELNKRLDQRDDLNDRAVGAALASMNARLDGMNEFRSTLRDQASGFVSRPEWHTRITGLEDKVRNLELAQSEAQGASNRSVYLMGIFLALLTFSLTFGMRLLDRKKERSNGPERRSV